MKTACLFLAGLAFLLTGTGCTEVREPETRTETTTTTEEHIIHPVQNTTETRTLRAY